MKPNEICANCRFFMAPGTWGDPRLYSGLEWADRGQCRRWPPDRGWGTPKPSDWCGAFAKERRTKS